MESIEERKFRSQREFYFMNEADVKVSFNSNGRLIRALELRVSGDIKTAESVFENYYLPVRTECQDGGRYYFYLFPELESVSGQG